MLSAVPVKQLVNERVFAVLVNQLVNERKHLKRLVNERKHS